LPTWPIAILTAYEEVFGSGGNMWCRLTKNAGQRYMFPRDLPMVADAVDYLTDRDPVLPDVDWSERSWEELAYS
jgi:hypothetical protein